MTTCDRRQLKNISIFILSLSLLVILMILGPYYLESSLRLSQTAEAGYHYSLPIPETSSRALETENFAWTASSEEFCTANIHDDPDSLSLPSAENSAPTDKKLLNDFIDLAVATAR